MGRSALIVTNLYTTRGRFESSIFWLLKPNTKDLLNFLLPKSIRESCWKIFNGNPCRGRRIMNAVQSLSESVFRHPPSSVTQQRQAQGWAQDWQLAFLKFFDTSLFIDIPIGKPCGSFDSQGATMGRASHRLWAIICALILPWNI